MLLAAMLTACQAIDTPSSSRPEDVYFPQHVLTPQAGMPAGDLSAELRLVSGCLLLQAEGTTYLALWPEAYSLDHSGPITIKDRSGASVASIGRTIHVGGGAYGDEQRAFVENDLLQEAVDRRCIADGYWLVSEVLP